MYRNDFLSTDNPRSKKCFSMPWSTTSKGISYLIMKWFVIVSSSGWESSYQIARQSQKTWRRLSETSLCSPCAELCWGPGYWHKTDTLIYVDQNRRARNKPRQLELIFWQRWQKFTPEARLPLHPTARERR